MTTIEYREDMVKEHIREFIEHLANQNDLELMAEEYDNCWRYILNHQEFMTKYAKEFLRKYKKHLVSFLYN